jgi:16S rRNA (uracil1498-N3)-methyltransferase
MSNLPRFHCPSSLNSGEEFELPAGTARHVQVRRMQPDDLITLFNGEGGEFKATILRMGRSDVVVRVGEKINASRELNVRVNLWCGITANERMDWLVEKATELGATSLLPITAERSVLKLKGERSDKKLAHWQAIAVAASEQSGRNHVMAVKTPVSLQQALLEAQSSEPSKLRWVLSLAAGTQELHSAIVQLQSDAHSDAQSHSHAVPLDVTVLSGPEGGLSPGEEAQALAAGFLPVSLGNRVLRAETAPLAVLSVLGALT